MAHIIESAEPGESLPTLRLRWIRLRSHAEKMPSAVLIAEGLPLRARRLLEQASARTIQDLLKLDPENLADKHNVGRSTLVALLTRAEESLPPVSVDRAAPDFIEVVELIAQSLPERSLSIIIDRFQRRTKTVDVARALDISRERVRQVEEKFVRQVRAASRRYRLPLQAVLDDDLVEFEELSSGRHAAQYAPSFYVGVARAVLGGGDSYVDAERYYAVQLDALLREIRNDPGFILGTFTVQRAKEMTAEFTPALSELPDAQVWDRICSGLRAADVDGRLVRRKPAVGRIIRALLRRGEGPVTVAVLVQQLDAVLARYGEVSYFDEVRLRNKLAAMADVHMLDQRTVSLELPDAGLSNDWVNRLVQQIEQAGKPYSIARFLDENDDAPFDSYALHSLLKKDDRVVQVGRRLYAAATYEAEGPLRIAGLIEEALSTASVPLTRRELVDYVRQRRDLMSTQMEHYFPRVPGLVQYTNDVVGLVPLDREVMLQMLSREAVVFSLLEDRGDENPVHVSRLWLIADSDPDLTDAEEKKIAKASKRWKSVVAEVRSSGLFFDLREG